MREDTVCFRVTQNKDCVWISLPVSPRSAAHTFVATSQPLPQRSITAPHRHHADELALIINDDDPLSQQIGKYYQHARHLPEANVTCTFRPGAVCFSTDESPTQTRNQIRYASPRPSLRGSLEQPLPRRLHVADFGGWLPVSATTSVCQNAGPTKVQHHFNSKQPVPGQRHRCIRQ